MRPSDRGGWGNELMLTVFRSVLLGVTAVDVDRGCGRADVGAGVGGGAKVVEGALKPLLGVLEADLLGEVLRFPVLLRVFATGRAGSAIEGGPLEGRDGRGRVVAILSLSGVSDMSRGRKVSLVMPE